MSLSSLAPSCGVLRSDGGWYAVMHVPSFEPEEDLAVRLLTAEGVLTHPGYFFDFPRESFLVFSLLPPEASFSDGVTRVLRHFASSAAPA
jgi:aspartate/methionine/tyrosine aminotransferase